jgi:ribosomal protein L3 glutamine methyltransferase
MAHIANGIGGMTAADWIERITALFEASSLHYGHGTDNARDEAAWLVLHVLGAPLDGSFEDWGRAVDESEAAEIDRLARARCSSGTPLAYLLGSARFAGLEFEVSPDVLVPRSPIAELILDGFRPWAKPARLGRVLDMCTGCGCIAVATALRVPGAAVDAVDISPAALDIAARNVRRYGLGQRVRLLQSDLFDDMPPAAYDLILANPPYVPRRRLAALPAEYRSEPSLALISGNDGLDAALRILHHAPSFLARDGILICEVGESEEALAALLPGLPFLWLEFARGGTGVFLLTRAELEEGRAAVAAVIEDRRHVV